MDNISEYLTREILTKECKDYKLITLGLLTSVEDGLNRVYPFLKEYKAEEIKKDISRFRNKVKEALYSQIHYGNMIGKQKGNSLLHGLLFQLKKKEVLAYKETYTEQTADKNLTVSQENTLAFKLSRPFDQEQFKKECPKLRKIKDPSELKVFHEQVIRHYYPLDFAGIATRLKKEDMEFWDELYPLIQKQSEYTLNKEYKNGIKAPVIDQYREDILQEISTDTYRFLFEKSKKKLGDELNTDLYFVNHLRQVCGFKYKEVIRRYEDKNLRIIPAETETLDSLFDRNTVYPQERKGYGSLEDLNIEDKEEISYALMEILELKKEPFYSRLTYKIEDKVAVLVKWVNEDKSYKEMAEEHQELSAEEQKRLYDKIRKDTSRIRKILQQRFREIVIEIQSTPYHGKR